MNIKTENTENSGYVEGYTDDELDVKPEVKNSGTNECDSDDDMYIKTSEILETENSTIHTIPEKSKVKYEGAYKKFVDWRAAKSIDGVTEKSILAYLEENSMKMKCSTLWSIYSMLKTTLNINENVDISKFSRLVPYLKKKSVGYSAKKSKVLTREQIDKFMHEANNDTYLVMKIILIMGLSGACRRDELTKMAINDVEDLGSVLVVKIPDSDSHVGRIFTVTNKEYMELYRKYAALRPAKTTNPRLFLKYSKGRCCNQVIGINTMGAVPSMIATYLGLPDAKEYTGHCFRRMSAPESQIKRHRNK